ncbi:hypothetical protein OF83DRAFT_1167676 [Amylostereum chailletii]|nr:hypothetical protein OF83DRAFT_1167676 [Amylostereum chailletii]
MSFAPKPGCPMCGIVSHAQRVTNVLDTPLSPSPNGAAAPEILWRDDNFTAWREKNAPVSSKVHVIIAFNLHVPSIYTLSSSDLPLLVHVRDLASRLLASFNPPSSPLLVANPATPTTASFTPLQTRSSVFRIGFITPPFYDSKIPVTDHLHAHAYIMPADKLGWFRGVAYSGLAWYDIDDLIAEIRESVSNNRVKSGYNHRRAIDMVPDAGARAGTADGREDASASIASGDLEEGRGTPLFSTRSPISPTSPSMSGMSTLSPPPSNDIPHLQV